MLFVLSSLIFSADMDLYYKGKEMEKNAVSQEDHRNVIANYKKFLKTTSAVDDVEIVASCYFSIGDILLNKLKQPQQAHPYFQKIIRSYSDSSWANLASDEISKIKVTKTVKPLMTPMKLVSKPNSEKGVIPYDKTKLNPSLIQKVDISEVKEAIRQLKEAQNPPDFNDEESIPTGTDMILAIFRNYGVELKNLAAVIYSISFQGKTEKNNPIRITAYRDIKEQYLIVNNMGVMLKNKKKYLFFVNTRQYHEIIKTSPKNIKYLYLAIMDKYSGLMFLNDFSFFAPDISYEESRENAEVLDYYPLVKTFKSYFKLKLDMRNKPYIHSASFGSDKSTVNTNYLKLSTFEVGKKTTFTIDDYKPTATAPSDATIPE